jgi:hypothetical protein
MKRSVLAAVAVAAVAYSVPAAATVLSFTAGTTTAGAVQTSTGSYTDIFTFSADAGDVISGSLTTHRLMSDPSDPASDILANLDFTAASLVNTTTGMTVRDFVIPGAGADETISIPSMILGAGDYSLSVSYNVTDASSVNGAAYSGPINLGSPGSVPEPATWAMFACAFGLVGFGMRQRRTQVSFNV